MSKELINKAIELGIENAESLTPAQLKIAISAAEKKLADSAELKKKAVSLGIITEEKTDADLSTEVLQAEASVALREKAVGLGILGADDLSDETLEVVVAYIEKYKAMANEEARETEVSEMLSEFLGVEDVYALSKEEIKDLLAKKEAEKAAGIDVVAEKSEEGKSNESFTVNRTEYVFADDAPGAFRYLGQRRTQKEWLEDSDALELMVAGRLSFVKPIKK
jgi:ethanolamine utilization microcompartment shell protein EutL